MPIDRRMLGNLLFFICAGAILGLWLYLMARYIGPNKRWFLRYTERAMTRRGLEVPESARRRLLHSVVYSLGVMTSWQIASAMFRPDSDPEIEKLRREAVERYRPMIRFMVFGVVLWGVCAVAALLVILIHHLLS